MFRASVIVPTRNPGHAIVDQLEALRPQALSEDLEVIVVDDASTDGTPEVVAAWITRHRLEDRFRLHARARRGWCNASRNDGAALRG